MCLSESCSCGLYILLDFPPPYGRTISASMAIWRHNSWGIAAIAPHMVRDDAGPFFCANLPARYKHPASAAALSRHTASTLSSSVGSGERKCHARYSSTRLSASFPQHLTSYSSHSAVSSNSLADHFGSMCSRPYCSTGTLLARGDGPHHLGLRPSSPQLLGGLARLELSPLVFHIGPVPVLILVVVGVAHAVRAPPLMEVAHALEGVRLYGRHQRVPIPIGTQLVGVPQRLQVPALGCGLSSPLVNCSSTPAVFAWD